MSYLRLIKNKMQNLAETMASVMNVEVAIADKNLTRIVGTGNFYTKLDESCAEDSLFAKVVNSGIPIVNLTRDEHCDDCSNKDVCPEFANMSYPIKSEDEVVGVISFASFDTEQAGIMRFRRNEYFNMLKETAGIVEQELVNIKITNKLIKDVAEVNEIINCLNKGIIILNSDNRIIHINSKALESLDISISTQKVINRDIHEFIQDIKLYDTGNNDLVDLWKINGKETRVMYSINKILLRNNEFSLMISFDNMKDIINIAKTYEKKDKIYFSNIIGNSKAILEAINRSKIAAATDSTILIQGASGTGKELFARSIHNEGLRKDGPFVALNCASIPETLIESELFGYEKGAFTGANTAGKKGKIELAHNGTLFLDEIGDLPLYMQTKLLRVLQERTIDKIGGLEPIDVNIRVISATNKNLKKLVEEGKFRLDLYYRLNIIPINLPELKDREDDVFLCTEYILKNLCFSMNIESKELSEEVKYAFKNYPWLGNIRELENVLEHGLCFSKGRYIELKDLPEYFMDNYRDEGLSHTAYDGSLEEMKLEFEKSVIRDMLNKYGNTVDGKKRVAEELNIGLTTLYRKINDYYN
ncbi:MAG: sigma 54-interacting transcriptional regulator [Tissierellaceae bacterium]|nr:sigma 54-interacting transcriptional regulator [Tissierellaceae bacterium]